MERDRDLASQCIQLLVDMSETPQHELIPRMLEYYHVSGTKDLNAEQIQAFVQLKTEERT